MEKFDIFDKTTHIFKLTEIECY